MYDGKLQSWTSVDEQVTPLCWGLRGSLERLQLDYVDVVFANKSDPRTPMEGSWTYGFFLVEIRIISDCNKPDVNDQCICRGVVLYHLLVSVAWRHAISGRRHPYSLWFHVHDERASAALRYLSSIVRCFPESPENLSFSPHFLPNCFQFQQFCTPCT